MIQLNDITYLSNLGRMPRICDKHGSISTFTKFEHPTCIKLIEEGWKIAIEKGYVTCSRSREFTQFGKAMMNLLQ